MNNIVSRLETALNIKLKRSTTKSEMNENTYCISNGLDRLCLSHIHFENFSALEPIFETLRYLTLIECSIADSLDLHQIKLESLTLKRCSISSEEAFNPDIPKARTAHHHFQFLYLEDMHVPHPGFFLPISNHLEYITFIKCTVSNGYELNLFPALYVLTINDTHFIESSNDIQYQRESGGQFTLLNFENMQLENFDYFVPISSSISILDLYNCEVTSLKSICEFPNLKTLRLSPNIQVNDSDIPDNSIQQFELKNCIITPKTRSYGWDKSLTIPDFNTEFLVSIAPYIQTLIIENHNLINIYHIKHFSRLNELNFKQCFLDLNNYISVASQIQNIEIDTVETKNQEAFKYFTKLESLEFSSNHTENTHHIDLKKLIPLKEHLKRMTFYDSEAVLNIDELKHFTAVEKLFTTVDSLALAQNILSIESLKDLSLYIDEQTPEILEPVTLDLQQLKNVEELRLMVSDEIHFKGIGNLKSLRTLTLNTNCDVENLGALASLEKLVVKGEVINKLPRLEQIKVLSLEIEEACIVTLLEKFPNLEKLKIHITEEQKIDISGLEKLKVLVFDCNSFDSIVSFENLPSLEELDLGNCEISSISKLDTLTSLKTLNLADNEIENIEGLQNLKNLERLNLFSHKISDLSILNKLPKLREVNVPCNHLTKEEIEKQFDKPEIVLWVYSPFSINYTFDH